MRRTARAVAQTSAPARVALITRARRGCRRAGASEAPATSQVPLITTIITVRTAILSAASVVAPAARCELAKTAPIATQAFGFATPSSAPPANDGAVSRDDGGGSGGAVATRKASR